MILFNDIKKYFPQQLNSKIFARNMIKEYLQYEALDYIFKSNYANDLAFIGGSCLRILHNIKRFSDDLDFDILTEKYSSKNHKNIIEDLCAAFKKKGFVADYTFKEKNDRFETMDGKLIFKGTEYKMGVSQDPRKVIHIKIQAQSQGYKYNPEIKMIDKFGVQSYIKAMPLEQIFASKLFVCAQRAKGRDYYDLVELAAYAKAAPGFVKQKFKEIGVKINSSEDVKKQILKQLEKVDLNEKINEISRFVFDKNDIQKVKNFPDWIRQKDFSTLMAEK